jgi:hypothetical protein
MTALALTLAASAVGAWLAALPALAAARRQHPPTRRKQER